MINWKAGGTKWPVLGFSGEKTTSFSCNNPVSNYNNYIAALRFREYAGKQGKSKFPARPFLSLTQGS